MQVMQDIIARIETGMTTTDDARTMAAIVARLARYELALREIAACGCDDDTARALRALVGQEHHPEGER